MKRKLEKKHDTPAYALLGKQSLPGQPKDRWAMPDLPAHFPKLDFEAMFNSGDPLEQTQKAISLAYALAAKLSALKRRLAKAKGNAYWMEVNWRDGVLVCRRVKRKENRFQAQI